MTKTVLKGVIKMGYDSGLLDGEARGEARGKLKGKIEAILTILKSKFGRIPSSMTKSLSKRTDETALESLLVQAAACTSLDDFAADL